MDRFGFDQRRHFLEALRGTLSTARADTLTAVLMVRVPRIHDINVIYSHDAADALVHALFDRIAAATREFDVVMRIEDAGYALILPNLLGAAQAELAAARILEACRAPIMADGHDLRVQPAVGIALYPSHAPTAAGLLRCAEIALGQLAPAGYGVYVAEDAGGSQGLKALELERALYEALDNDELHLCLQPKIALATGALTGAEALVRWTRADGERVPPDVFIPIAERSNLIVRITLWTLNAALRACSDHFQDYPGFSVAVNLSPIALNDPDIFEFVAQSASIWCTDTDQLTLEITEGALIQDPEAAISILDRFHAEHIRLSIDDFGTGYSSLSQLGRLSVGELKIDKSFVMNMMKSEKNAKIVRSIIDLAHNFGMTVVAEGIEDGATLALLDELGCDYGQGYYIGRPMPLDDFAAWAARFEPLQPTRAQA